MASVIDTEHFRGMAAASQQSGGNSGGGVEDILKRLGNLESLFIGIRAEIGEIKGMLPHFATKADVESVRTEVQSVRTEVQSVRTEVQSVRAEVQSVRTEVAVVRGEISALEATIIKWIIGTVLSTAALAFSVAKLVN